MLQPPNEMSLVIESEASDGSAGPSLQCSTTLGRFDRRSGGHSRRHLGCDEVICDHEKPQTHG